MTFPSPHSKRLLLVVTDPLRRYTGSYRLVFNDLSAPIIELPAPPSNTSVSCSNRLLDGDYGVASASHPFYNPVVESFVGTPSFGCYMAKLWIASTEFAVAIVPQKFNLLDTTPPVLQFAHTVPVRCGEIASGISAQIFAPDNCGGRSVLTFVDSVPFSTCPQTVIRNWTAVDTCGNSATRSQTLEVGPSNGTEITNPIFPRRGAINVPRRPVLSWEEVPLAESYNIWLWRAGTPPLLVESSTNVDTTYLSVSTDLEDGTDHLWRVDVVLPGTLVPGHEWEFTTKPLSDLVATQVTAPPSVLTGSAISISWTVENRGKGGPATTLWYDSVYLSEQRQLDLRSSPRPILVGNFRNPRCAFRLNVLAMYFMY